MVEAIWYLQQGQWMEQRNEGTETSDFAGRRGLGNMVRVEWGGAKSLQDCKEKDDREIVPMKFVTLEEFHQRKLHPGEALPLFIHDLKKLLDRAMPDVDATARGQPLLRQFLAGLPAAVSTKWYTIGTLHRYVSIVWWPCVALSTTAGKLTPRWEGNWAVKTVKSDQHGNYGWQAKQGCSYQSTAASHSAQLHWTARWQWKQAIGPPTGWSPCVHPTRHPCTYRRYPQRDRRPPNRFSARGRGDECRTWLDRYSLSELCNILSCVVCLHCSCTCTCINALRQFLVPVDLLEYSWNHWFLYILCMAWEHG